MKKRLEQLPPELAAKLPAIRAKWIALGLSTERVERAKVEAALAKMYGQVNKPKPRFTIMLRSPLEAVTAVGLMRLGVFDKISNAQVSDQVSDQVRDQVSDQVRAQVRDQVRAQVSDQVSAQVRDQVRAQVSDQVSDQVSAQVSAQVSDQVRAQVSDQVSAQVRAQVSDQVSDQVSEIFSNWWWWEFGQFGTWLNSFYDIFSELGVDISPLDGVKEYNLCAGMSFLFWDWAVVSDRPAEIHRDERGRLHRLDGPALRYLDGFSIYAVHGVRCAADIIENPKSITVSRIEKETNQELRRVMIELYGQAKYLLDAGAKKVHSDDYGQLYRKEIPGDEDLVMVKVVNSTAEPDGSFRDYFLRVPPTVKTAREAVAWTFGKTADAYAPLVET